MCVFLDAVTVINVVTDDCQLCNSSEKYTICGTCFFLGDLDNLIVRCFVNTSNSKLYYAI